MKKILLNNKKTIENSLRFIFILFFLSAVCFQSTFASGQIKRIVTIKKTNVDIKEILYDIRKQSGLGFVYDDKELSSLGKVTLNVENVTIESALNQLLKNSGFSFKEVDKGISIFKLPINVVKKKNTVKGRIIDSDEKPITGATVLVDDSTNGTITDESGCFSITAEVGQIINVYFVGMKNYRKVVTESSDNLIIKMEVDALAVEDVVVTGYQTLSRRESASAVTTVKAKDIYVAGATSIAQMLQGKVAGMMVMNTSGEPSATPKIRVRGNSTLSGNQSPVWVVDGIILEQSVPFNASEINSEDAAYLIGNAIAGVNPQDIETITVLKDASATAIYGVKAANGVIVITTKNGSEGRAVVSYSGDVIINERPSYGRLDRMNSAQRMQLSKEIVESGIQYPRIPSGDSYEGALQELYTRKITQTEFNKKVIMLQGRNTDWFKELFRTGISHSHNINVSGGTSQVKYYFSAGYNNNLGAAKGSDSERLTTLGKIDVKLNKFIDFSAKIDFNTTENNGYSGEVNPYNYAYQRSRTLPAYNEDGSPAFYKLESYKNAPYSFINELNTTGQKSVTNNFGGLFALNVKIIKGLKYSGTFSYNRSNSNLRDWATDHSYQATKIRGYDYNAFEEGTTDYNNSPMPYGGTLKNNKINSRNYTIRNTLNYVETFNEKHNLNLMTGVEARSNKYEGVSMTGYGWIPEFGEKFSPVYTTKFINDYVMKDRLNPTNTNTITQVGSYFGTATYTLDNRYIFNANIRFDGANKFGTNPKYRWLPTWSVAGKWLISNEQFMKKQEVFDLLAVRGSYGIQGNIHDSATPELVVQVGKRDPNANVNTSTIYRLPNPDLRWEKTSSWNVGLDFSLLEGRINGAFDVYKKHTSDLIMDKQVSTSNGRRFIYINAGEMNNLGVEGNINFEIIKSKLFDWRLGLNLSHNSNEITSANGDVYNNIEEVQMLLRGDIAVEGEAAGSMYSYRYAGLSHENGYPLLYAKDGRLVHGGEIQMLELVNSGSIFPTLSGGFDTQVTFKKRLTLTLGFTYNLGGVKRLPNVYEDAYKVFDPLLNVSTDVMNRWKNPGDEAFTDIPALIDKEITKDFNKNGQIATRPGGKYDTFVTLYNNSDVRVAKSDYVRLRMVALNYVVPEKWLQKLKISRLTLRFQANNLHVWASDQWRGLDPETPDSNIPLLPDYSFGVNVSF